MNKLKREIQNLRTYLGRDKEGTQLLNVIAKTANSLRQNVAALTEEKESAKNAVGPLRQELETAYAEIETLKTDLRKETAIRQGAETREKKLLSLNSAMKRELDPEVVELNDEEKLCPSTLEYPAKLLKSICKRFKRAPTPLGGQKIALESLVPRHTTEEFIWLGKLVALMAMYDFPVTVVALTTVQDFADDEWEDVHLRKFIQWYEEWMDFDELEVKTKRVGRGKTIRYRP